MIQFHNGKFINNDGLTHYCWLQAEQLGRNTNASLAFICAQSNHIYCGMNEAQWTIIVIQISSFYSFKTFAQPQKLKL